MNELANAPVELVARGETIVKLENSTQMSIAIQRPRDEKKILTDCLKELDLYPSMAEEAIYNKPVGKDDKGKMKYAEGLSIRAAESIGNRWDNSSFGVEIVAEDEESASIAAVWLDYERNTRHIAMQRVSKFYKSKTGQIIRHSPDRFDLVLKANGSKNLREIILRSLPAGLKKEYEIKARNILKGGSLPGQRMAVVNRFADLGVIQRKIEEFQGKGKDEWTREDVIELAGLANAIRDGETSIEETFGGKESSKKEDPQVKSGLQPKETIVDVEPEKTEEVQIEDNPTEAEALEAAKVAGMVPEEKYNKGENLPEDPNKKIVAEFTKTILIFQKKKDLREWYEKSRGEWKKSFDAKMYLEITRLINDRLGKMKE